MAKFPHPEKAILIGIELQGDKSIPIAESMVELARLAYTAGVIVKAKFTQKREKPDPKYCMGSGKVEEIHAAIHTHDADLVIFDQELSPSQSRNLEEDLGVKIIDRTELILDIFAQHAHSREGSLQVELAQYQFLLPRLTGHGVSMSRLGGGIGTRGPGETKLEHDRRRIRKIISDLRKELKKVEQQRALRRAKRRGAAMPLISLVGYTNSGKSTLLNALTNAGVLVQDKLFATLDPTVRRFSLPGGKTILISDTVGFIQKLPHQLVDAFHATLEEVSQADQLLHIVDASSPYAEDQINAVYNVLEEIGAITKKIITVFNKIDLVKDQQPLDELAKKYAPSVKISALKKEGFPELMGLLSN
ncbi:MAG: GTPase HflX [Candidatus Margulisbacteria bacterium]|nr:GTPase HflX [Candidatus Margulisiibacteriota bacterium]MBU1022054.1 GTPase HflX [Candidatus Margulisiibacteriota bacterium]MBU1729649.1 GTPase HflX [Candidatus Margulisiibacteriota bacterium]MBU1954969.1 GTPase HflX [Candidatus Margulisiibacteriota bacterium]